MFIIPIVNGVRTDIIQRDEISTLISLQVGTMKQGVGRQMAAIL